MTRIAIKALTLLVALAASVAFLCQFPSNSLAGSIDLSVPLLVDISEIAPMLERANDKYPESPELHIALGCIYINLGALDPQRSKDKNYTPPEFGLAEENLQKAMKLDPRTPLPSYYMGLLEIHRLNHNKAIAWFQKTLELDPMDVRARQQLHTLYFSLERYATSILFLEDSIKKIPGEPNLYHRLAASYLAIKDFVKSRKNAEKALSLAYNPETHNMLATTYQRQELYDKADSEFRKILNREPGNINAHLGIARNYALRGNYPEARKWIGRALSLENQNPEALRLLEEIQEIRKRISR